jgi:hypothetical protein
MDCTETVLYLILGALNIKYSDKSLYLVDISLYSKSNWVSNIEYSNNKAINSELLLYLILDDRNFKYRGEHVYPKLQACRGM